MARFMEMLVVESCRHDLLRKFGIRNNECWKVDACLRASPRSNTFFCHSIFIYLCNVPALLACTSVVPGRTGQTHCWLGGGNT